MKVKFEHIKNLVDSLKFEFNYVKGTTTTICTAILPSGYTVSHGYSSCVDPNEYNKALGDEYAKKDAIEKATKELWKLEGYLLSVSNYNKAINYSDNEKYINGIAGVFQTFENIAVNYGYKFKKELFNVDFLRYYENETCIVVTYNNKRLSLVVRKAEPIDEYEVLRLIRDATDDDFRDPRKFYGKKV